MKGLKIMTKNNEINKGSASIIKAANNFMKSSIAEKYSYNFHWLGQKIVQYPQDIVAIQELLFEIKPDLIIETGIAHGGSLIFYASMLELNALCGGPQKAEVAGVDIDIRAHNRKAIERHPLFKRITMFEGSSINSDIIKKVKEKSSNKKNIFVCLDAMHTHEHVLAELEAYAPLVSVGSYCIVFDTIIEDLSADFFEDRPWSPGNNPKTAVLEFVENNPDYVIDYNISDKLLITVAPDGYLKRTR